MLHENKKRIVFPLSMKITLLMSGNASFCLRTENNTIREQRNVKTLVKLNDNLQKERDT